MQPRACLLTLGLVLLVASRSIGQEPPKEASAEGLQKAASEVYDQLLQQHRANGEATVYDVQLLGAWSRRLLILEGPFGSDAWFLAQSQWLGVPDPQEIDAQLVKAMAAHVQRMQKIEKMITARVADGTSSQLAASTAKFLRLEAELLAARYRETTQALRDRVLDIELPDVAEAAPLTVSSKSLTVDVNKAGQYHILGKRYTAKEIEKDLERRMTEDRGKVSILIRADRETQHKHVVQLMDVCAKVGVNDVSVSVKPDN